MFTISRRVMWLYYQQPEGTSDKIKIKGYSIIGSESGFAFTVNLGSDSLGKSNDFRRV